MDYLPLFVDLKERPCLIIGGGEVAHRKAKLLLSAGALVTMVAREFDNALLAMGKSKAVQLICAEFQQGHVAGYDFVIGASNNKQVNAQIAAAAKAEGIWVNMVDDSELGNVIMPAIIDRSPVIVAVSSSGRSPVLARHLKHLIEICLPQGLGKLAELAGHLRPLVKKTLSSLSERRWFWEKIFTGSAVSLALAGKSELATQFIVKALNTQLFLQGEVTLVGAGPGDPGLLTLKALQAIHSADVVLIDSLVSDEIRRLIRKDAKIIEVGKRAGCHLKGQSAINALLVEHGQLGARVCRLKGGDPFIFGRGGEEVAALRAANIPYQIIPGVTAAIGCAAYAGIPLTHRDYAQGVTFMTGHYDLKGEENIANLSKVNHTLVIYMGKRHVEKIARQLIDAGRSAHTAVAIIENGTTKQQIIVQGTLENIAKVAKGKLNDGPALLVVGDVVKFAQSLSWFSQSDESPMAVNQLWNLPTPLAAATAAMH